MLDFFASSDSERCPPARRLGALGRGFEDPKKARFQRGLDPRPGARASGPRRRAFGDGPAARGRRVCRRSLSTGAGVEPAAAGAHEGCEASRDGSKARYSRPVASVITNPRLIWKRESPCNFERAVSKLRLQFSTTYRDILSGAVPKNK
jgi:hypothetical protein